MITDLFVVASGIAPDTVARVVPPGCRRGASCGDVSTSSGADGELVLDFPEWRPRAPAHHLLPSLSVLTGIPYAARFEIAGWAAGAWSPWIATATIGPGRFPPLAASTGPLACDIDVFTSAVPLERLQLRIRVAGPDVAMLATAPWMATLSACDLAPPVPGAMVTATARLPVPALTQLAAPPEIALRICSPTSVAMVLDYWGRAAPLTSVADDSFHAETDRYGVWPAAIRAAGRRGVAGYLLRFPDWAAAVWCFERKLPIVASLRYAAGELTGAPLSETSGHLVVLTGAAGAHVYVNDPVAPTAADVPRRYRLDEIERAWLTRTGVGYVLFRPDRLPAPVSTV